MNAAKFRSLASVLAVSLYIGCGDASEGELSGSWAARDSVGAHVGVVFGSGGTALWISERVPGVHDTAAVRFRIDTTASPAQLDFTGFMDGRWAGMTLYGIYERAGRDTLRFDYQAAIPGQGAARPDSFTMQTMVFTRTR